MLAARTNNESKVLHRFLERTLRETDTLSPKLLKTRFDDLKALTFTFNKNAECSYAFKNIPSGRNIILSLLLIHSCWYITWIRPILHFPFQTIMTILQRYYDSRSNSCIFGASPGLSPGLAPKFQSFKVFLASQELFRLRYCLDQANGAPDAAVVIHIGIGHI